MLKTLLQLQTSLETIDSARVNSTISSGVKPTGTTTALRDIRRRPGCNVSLRECFLHIYVGRDVHLVPLGRFVLHVTSAFTIDFQNNLRLDFEQMNC